MEDSIRIKIDKLADEINKIVFPDKQGGNLESKFLHQLMQAENLGKRLEMVL